jgi:hypothetical protein
MKRERVKFKLKFRSLDEMKQSFNLSQFYKNNGEIVDSDLRLNIRNKDNGVCGLL